MKAKKNNKKPNITLTAALKVNGIEFYVKSTEDLDKVKEAVDYALKSSTLYNAVRQALQ